MKSEGFMHNEIADSWCMVYRGSIHERSQTAVARARIANRICDVASYSRNKSHVRLDANFATRFVNKSYRTCDVDRKQTVYDVARATAVCDLS